MLNKEKDCIKKNIEQLNSIKKNPNLSKEKLAKVEKELKTHLPHPKVSQLIF